MDRSIKRFEFYDNFVICNNGKNMLLIDLDKVDFFEFILTNSNYFRLKFYVSEKYQQSFNDNKNFIDFGKFDILESDKKKFFEDVIKYKQSSINKLKQL